MKEYKKRSALTHVLMAFVPYSRENLMLAYKPSLFFNELEKSSGYRQDTLKNAYWRAQQRGYIKNTGRSPQLTASGLEEVRPFMAKHLGRKARLVVIFDVPEDSRAQRQQLRGLLKSWGFEQIQKSVWATDMDYRELLIEAVAELRLGGCVEIYESLRLFPAAKL